MSKLPTGIALGSPNDADSSIRASVGSLLDCDKEVQVLHITSVVAEPLELAIKDVHLTVVLDEGAAGVLHIQAEGDLDVEVILNEQSQLECSLVVNGGMVRQRAKVGTGASMHWKNVTRGADVLQDVTSLLQGDSAHSDTTWIFHAVDSDKQKLSARNEFQAANGSGEIVIRGVAEDHAHVSCNGVLEVSDEGDGTKTFLTEDVLMLDETAKVDAVPALEIKTDNVIASHSASVRCVTPEELFYFRSRGIEEEEGRRMYVEGFLKDLTH